MADTSGFEFWQAGELPLSGAGGADSGGFEFWQAGEQPPAFTAPTSIPPLEFAASGASASAGTLRLTIHSPFAVGVSTSSGSLRMRIGRHFAASGASTSAGSLRATVLGVGMALVTQAGLLIDVERTAPINVTQSGALLDAIRTPPINVTQAGAILDAERTPPIQVTQAGVIVDVNSTAPLRVTQAGLIIDARYQRPESLLNCWEFHVLDPNTHYLTFLDAAFSKAYMGALSDCGGGAFTIHRDDPKATTANLAVGNVVMVRYKNVDIGAWVMENFEETLVDQGEGPAEVIVVSGRGLLGFLEKGIVYPSDLADAGTAERAFDGVTKASIFLDLYNEYLLRGGGELNVDFTAVNDSRALPWTDSAYLKYKAGQTLLDVARNLAGQGLELTVDPDRTLRAWIQAGTDLSATVHFREGQNLLSSRKSTEGTGLANVVLGEGQGIFVETTDATSIASHHRRETYLAVRNTADTGQVATANTILLNGWAEPRAALTLEVLADPFYPFFDYQIGDVVHIDVPGEIDADYRVLAIAINEGQGPCDLRVTLSINDLATEYLQRLQRAFDASLQSVKPGPGSSGSLASSGTEPGVGASGTGLANGAIKNNHIDWGLGPNQVDAADVPITDTGNYYTGNQVEAALQEIGSSLGSLGGSSHAAVTLGTDADTLLGLTGQQITIDTQAANLVLAGPTTGAAADPAFRALVEADLPATALLTDGSRDGATSGAQQFVSGSRHGDDTNHADFDGTGHLTFAGTARPWRDELGELLGKKRIGVRITEDLAEGTLLFSDSCQIADDYVITNVQLNHDKDLTVSIYPHLHWFQASANVPNWLLQYRWQVNGAAKTTSWTPVKSTGLAFAYSAGTLHQISLWAAIAVPGGSTLSDIVQFRIMRDTDNDSGLFGTPGTDPLSGNASALMFDVHFQINSLGSTDEYTK